MAWFPAILKGRRRLTLLVVGFVLTLLAVGAFLYLHSRDSLADFVNQDLRRVNDQPQTALDEFLAQHLPEHFSGRRTRLNRLLERSLPEQFRADRPWLSETWYLWPHQMSNGRAGYILFAGFQLIMIPGASSAAVYFLGEDGQHLGGSEFPTGWRIDIDDASFRPDPTLGVCVIEVKSGAAINGRDVHRQIYGVFGERVGLLRLEGSGGQMLDNVYSAPNHTIGPAIPTMSPEEWEMVLRQAGPARALEALTWIGGDHRRDAETPPANIHLEDADSVRRVLEVRRRPEVRRIARALTQSEHPWVRDAAFAALKALGEGPEAAAP
jgi:hypothetical protein